MTVPSLDLVLRPSARAHHLLFWLHVLPLALLPAAMASGPWMVGVAALIGASWLSVRRHPAFGYGPRAIARVVVDPEGRWSIVNIHGKRLDAELLGDSVVWSGLLILNFRDADGRRRTRVLLGDETTPEGLRRLRARLGSGASNQRVDS
jgi:toxin CptA